MDNRNIQFVITPGKAPESKYSAIYEDVYKCWHSVWAQTFLENDNNPHLKSDNFTRQDFIGAIQVNGTTVAMSVFKFANAASETFKYDSYFSNWSPEHISALCRNGNNILVCSHFTIHPSARGTSLGFAMRDLLMAYTTEFVLKLRPDAMTGAMRKNRNAHQVAYNWGALPIAADVPSGHGDLVDLVAFYPDEVAKKRQGEIIQMTEQLWETKLVIPSSQNNNLNYDQNVPHKERKLKIA